MVDLLEHHSRLEAYYTPLLKEHGDHYRGVGWVTEHLQTVRFEVLSAVGDIRGASILDVGCGVGHFLDWLHSHGFVGDYVGLEVQEPMVEKARANHPQSDFPHARFDCGDFVTAAGDYEADYVMASGIFPLGDMDLLRLTVATMFERARIGVAFNCLSSFTPRREPEYFLFADPCEVFDFCTTLTKVLLFRHDYLPQDFTVFLYKD
jgi:SAM-dependent methyltransferase